jgi:hypothetical protein
VSEERENLAAELERARARVARLEQEAEVNRALLARALVPVTAPPRRHGGGVGFWHAVSLIIGVGLGVLVTIALVVARGVPTPPVPLPPERPRSAALKAIALPSIAGAAQAATGAPPPAAHNEHPDSSGTLNLSASSAATVYVDGQRAGAAPLRGYAVQPGEHRVRFVCASEPDAARDQAVVVPPFAEVDVDHHCQ